VLCLDSFPLWSRTLGASSGPDQEARESLRTHFQSFRSRVSQLVSTLGSELPGLTVHDITHLDALWRVAGEIAGEEYPINPAEAFVLGGTFLLHDAAHVLAAYPRGLVEVKETLYWKDLVAQLYRGVEPPSGSPEERSALFLTLRHLHAEQSHKLPFAEWKLPGKDTTVYLLENLELREHYGGLIGLIASSHHWSPHRVAETLRHRIVTPPTCLPAHWTVDALKVAFLLRTADAAHLDAQRAPWFLFALRRPNGISEDHWRFQAKLGQPVRTSKGELALTGSSFSITERKAWWLGYDAAVMIDNELRAAHGLLQDEDRPPFAATGVQGVQTPEVFARHIPTDGWQPISVAPRIDDVPRVIELLGGAKLYREDPVMALRELLQNAIDAVRALRAIRGLEEDEGKVVVALESYDSDSFSLSVTDTGIGMSRTVLTRVLLNFGESLWNSDRLRDEWPGLASCNFTAAGQFGIGFFAVFVLGESVTVSTRRHTRHSSDAVEEWVLAFDSGVRGRPLLREPFPHERLPRPGTQVSVRIPRSVCQKFLDQLHSKEAQFQAHPFLDLLLFSDGPPPDQRRSLIAAHEAERGKPWQITGENLDSEEAAARWSRLVAWICPASDVTIEVRTGSKTQRAVSARDWRTLSEVELLDRMFQRGGTGLVPLTETGGSCVGRLGLGPEDRAAEAALVFGGLRCGKLGGLTGVALAEPPGDLLRQEGIALASAEAWKRWAELILQNSKEAISIRRLRFLYALCPESDLPVVLVGYRTQLGFAQCAEVAKGVNKVEAFFGELQTMAWDPPEWGGFGRARVVPEFARDVWFLPQESVPRALKIAPVAYQKKLEQCLVAAWGKYSVREKVDVVIARVAGKPVYREAFVYERLK